LNPKLNPLFRYFEVEEHSDLSSGDEGRTNVELSNLGQWLDEVLYYGKSLSI
jgi:hypothetical protein